MILKLPLTDKDHKMVITFFICRKSHKRYFSLLYRLSQKIRLYTIGIIQIKLFHYNFMIFNGGVIQDKGKINGAGVIGINKGRRIAFVRIVTAVFCSASRKRVFPFIAICFS